MSTNCDACGYRDNEIKSGSAISEKGRRITLKVEDKEDLSRDILKVRRESLIVEASDSPAERDVRAFDTGNRIGVTGWNPRREVHNRGRNPRSGLRGTVG